MLLFQIITLFALAFFGLEIYRLGNNMARFSAKSKLYCTELRKR